MRNRPKPLAELVLRHVGRPAVILGGGMSLPEQIKVAPPNAIYVAANEHACVMKLPCDYIVAVDNIEDKLRAFGKPIISSRQWADYRMFKQPVTNSGCCAAFCAWAMGCAPIILVGMDCYKGGTYCHDPKAKSSGVVTPLANHIGRWQKLRGIIPLAAIRSAGGPTLNVFPLYNASENSFTIPSEQEVLRQVRGVVVDVVKKIDFKPHTYLPGERVELSAAEVRHGSRLKSLKESPHA